ncbi:hypothetical protein PES01_38700 [Pseudoalteromonas espejiana]|uniref:Uncharacterized protein n=1 Tax=Pseudoalteromonas espejiana TaxID=28107 RepID=A0A510Y115_9GAMM|nr:hypothetical protein PES01_38700 [Pseudoalteromonas espejiana]
MDVLGVSFHINDAVVIDLLAFTDCIYSHLQYAKEVYRAMLKLAIHNIAAKNKLHRVRITGYY